MDAARSPPTPTACSRTWSWSTGRKHARDAAQLDRPLDGAEVDFAARRASNGDAARSSPRGPTRCSAPPTWCSRPSIRWSPRITTPRAARRGRGLPRGDARARATSQRTELAKEKTGVFTGGYAINPVNGEKLPIWIADYVLMGYGTGAIMAVPGHDERDYEFARTFGLPIREVVAGGDVEEAAYVDHERGVARELDDARRHASRSTACRRPRRSRRSPRGSSATGKGQQAVNYKLRDWLFSRQRYWGEPFPIVLGRRRRRARCPRRCCRSRCPRSTTSSPTGTRRARRWRKLDRVGRHDRPRERQACAARDQHDAAVGGLVLVLPALPRPAERRARSSTRSTRSYWMPVDLYVGGAEHAVLHLLYARFWHKVLFDIGLVSHARAVHEAGPPGHDPGRGRREDVEVASATSSTPTT